MMASKITIFMEKLSETFMKDFMEVEWLTHKALDVGGSVMA